MKHFLFLLLVVAFISCGDKEYNDLLPNTQVNLSIDLSLPTYLDLQVPGGWANTPVGAGYGIKGIFIYNRNNAYVAFERACPHLAVSDCSRMSFDGTQLICPCDDSSFNILSGGASTSGVSYNAREYYVQEVSPSLLRITNY